MFFINYTHTQINQLLHLTFFKSSKFSSIYFLSHELNVGYATLGNLFYAQYISYLNDLKHLNMFLFLRKTLIKKLMHTEILFTCNIICIKIFIMVRKKVNCKTPIYSQSQHPLSAFSPFYHT